MKKFKKLIAVMVLGVTLCGSVLTAQAATPRTCANHTPVRTEENYRTVIATHTHSENGEFYECKVTTIYRREVVSCSTCGAVIRTAELPSTISHNRVN